MLPEEVINNPTFIMWDWFIAPVFMAIVVVPVLGKLVKFAWDRWTNRKRKIVYDSIKNIEFRLQAVDHVLSRHGSIAAYQIYILLLSFSLLVASFGSAAGLLFIRYFVYQLGITPVFAEFGDAFTKGAALFLCCLGLFKSIGFFDKALEISHDCWDREALEKKLAENRRGEGEPPLNTSA